MNKFDFKKIFEWLAQILRCPVCGYRCGLEQSKILDGKDDKSALNSILIHTDCEKCKSSIVFSIAVDGPEIFSMGMPTDLTSSDTTKFKNSAPLNSDDILAAHQFLKEFDGDFRQALGPQ
jgi:hypothetical protein